MPIQINDPHLPAPSLTMTPRDLSAVTYLIIHHTDGAPDQTVPQIDQEHRNEGWAMIGYNYVVDGAGSAGRLHLTTSSLPRPSDSTLRA